MMENSSSDYLESAQAANADRRQAAQAFMASLDLLGETFEDDDGIGTLPELPIDLPPDDGASATNSRIAADQPARR